MRTLNNLSRMLVMLLSFMTVTSLYAVDFKVGSFQEIPKEWKSPETYKAFGSVDGDLLIYYFSEGKLELLRMDQQCNIKSWSKTNKLPTRLLSIKRIDDKINAVFYGDGQVIRQIFDVSSLQPTISQVIIPKVVEGKSVAHNSAEIVWSPNKEYVGVLAMLDERYIPSPKGNYRQTLYLFDKDFNKLAEERADWREAEKYNKDTYVPRDYEMDLKVTDEGELYYLHVINERRNVVSETQQKWYQMFNKNISTADCIALAHVYRLTAKGEKSNYDFGAVVDNGVLMHPTIVEASAERVLIAGFYGNHFGYYAAMYSILDGFVTIDCSLSASQATQKADLSFDDKKWQCAYPNCVKGIRSCMVKKTDDGFVVSNDVDSRVNWNSDDGNYWRDMIWIDADGSNPRYYSWGGKNAKRNIAGIGYFYHYKDGQLYTLDFYGKDWANCGPYQVRSCDKNGNFTEKEIPVAPELGVELQVIPIGTDTYIFWDRQRVNKKDCQRLGTITL